MKTVKIDDGLFERAERLAVERGLSVDDLVADVMAKVTAGESPEAYRARMDLVDMARRADVPRRIIPWTREELYERGVSGHERDRLRGDGSEDGAGEVGEGRGDHAG